LFTKAEHAVGQCVWDRNDWAFYIYTCLDQEFLSVSLTRRAFFLTFDKQMAGGLCEHAADRGTSKLVKSTVTTVRSLHRRSGRILAGKTWDFITVDLNYLPIS
jgi:hypothetical protein